MIIPAGPHRLWAAWYDKSEIPECETEHQIAALVQIEPIIGWVVEEEGDRAQGPLPRPITPQGTIKSGIIRKLGEDKLDIHEATIVMALQNWRYHLETARCECHGSTRCPDVDWEAQERLDANADLKAHLTEAMRAPRVARPVRPARD